jgi:hypothetical protein
MIKLDDGVVRPQTLANLLARDQLAPGFKKHAENLKGLLLKADPSPFLAQHSRPKIELKRTESHA